jgi:hypothetical protein
VVQPLSCSLTLFFASGVAWSGTWWPKNGAKELVVNLVLFGKRGLHRWDFLPQHSQPTVSYATAPEIELFCGGLRKALPPYKLARSCKKLMGNEVLNNCWSWVNCAPSGVQGELHAVVAGCFENDNIGLVQAKLDSASRVRNEAMYSCRTKTVRAVSFIDNEWSWYNPSLQRQYGIYERY